MTHLLSSTPRRGLRWRRVFLVAAYMGAIVVLPLIVGTANWIHKILPTADPLQPPSYSGELPAPPTPDPNKMIAVVIAGVEGAEIGDTLEAFEPLARSGVFNVYTVAPERAVLPLVPGSMAGASTLDFVPHFSFAEYDALVGRPPDLIAIPALTNYSPEHDAVVLDWIRGHVGPNTTVLGICVGDEVVADSGLAAGHTAASNSQVAGYVESHEPNARWLHNVRYYDDGAIVTSNVLTSGLDATLHVVDRFAGRAKAIEVARQIGFTHTEVLDDPRLEQPTANDFVRVGAIAGFEGPKQQLGVLMYDGVTELGVSGIVDPLEGSLSARTLFGSADRTIVRSANGFQFVPRYSFETLPAVDRVLVAPGENPSAKQQVVSAWTMRQPQRPVEDIYRNAGAGQMAYDVSFADITRTRNGSLARATATMLLYAGASQVADTTLPVGEVFAALTVSLIGAASIYVASHRSSPRRGRAHPMPKAA